MKQRTKAKEMLRVEMHRAIRGVGLESGMGLGGCDRGIEGSGG